MNDEGIRELLIIANDLVKTKKDMRRLNQAIDKLEGNKNKWWAFRFHPSNAVIE
tara:strand:- start:42 stop:203 length:162 start_codon:yes stop_codon:yes gene_type:complete